MSLFFDLYLCKETLDEVDNHKDHSVTKNGEQVLLIGCELAVCCISAELFMESLLTDRVNVKKINPLCFVGLIQPSRS